MVFPQTRWFCLFLPKTRETAMRGLISPFLVRRSALIGRTENIGMRYQRKIAVGVITKEFVKDKRQCLPVMDMCVRM